MNLLFYNNMLVRQSPTLKQTQLRLFIKLLLLYKLCLFLPCFLLYPFLLADDIFGCQTELELLWIEDKTLMLTALGYQKKQMSYDRIW